MASLNNSISVRLEGKQRLKLDYLSERNYRAKPVHLIRAGIDLLVALAEQNDGLIPAPEHCILRNALIRRARHDAARSKHK